MLQKGKQVPIFQLQDTLLCHLGQICVPSSKHSKIILEMHYYQVTGHFGIEKTVAMMQKYFYSLNLHDEVGKYITSCTDCVIANPRSRSTAYILFLLLSNPSNPLPWITCQDFLPSSIEMTMFSWSSKNSLRWTFWGPTRSIIVEATTKLFFE